MTLNKKKNLKIFFKKKKKKSFLFRTNYIYGQIINKLIQLNNYLKNKLIDLQIFMFIRKY